MLIAASSLGLDTQGRGAVGKSSALRSQNSRGCFSILGVAVTPYSLILTRCQLPAQWSMVNKILVLFFFLSFSLPLSSTFLCFSLPPSLQTAAEQSRQIHIIDRKLRVLCFVKNNVHGLYWSCLKVKAVVESGLLGFSSVYPSIALLSKLQMLVWLFGAG